jgi:hypothetical protein
MTILNGTEIDNIEYNINITKQFMFNQQPIDDVLHVIAVISNPALYASRYILAKQFLYRLKHERNIEVYVVELAYGEQPFYITNENNPKHLQLRVETPLWHKENMINLGIQKLLPNDWKAVAWIDVDIEFESSTWALDTLKLLNGYKDIVQLFSHCIFMDKNQSALEIFTGFGYQYDKKQPYCPNPLNYWQPGYGWAINRKAYEKIGGLYEYAILGSGDKIMALSLIGRALDGFKHINLHDEYKQTIIEYESKMKLLRLGYVPGVIRHYYHGTRTDRKYVERWRVLIDNQYNPLEHVIHNSDGVLVPTNTSPPNMWEQIQKYFYARNEDA